ncbi:MAG TPA: TolC family protein, partial [Planctomycetota bacterium]|nr:TolC family protein [Planctomycetota bacterium]
MQRKGKIAVLVTSVVFTLAAGKARPEEVTPVKAPEPARTDSAHYPTIKILDFAVSRRCLAIDLTEDLCSKQPLQSGLTLPKPTELPIDLPTVLRLAGCDNLEVHFACAALEEAEARTLAAKMTFLPSLYPQFINRWHQGQTQNSNGTFITVDKQNNFYGNGAVLDLHIGESIYATLAARRREQAHEAGVEVAAVQARYNAVVAYFDLVLAQTELAINVDRLKQADETVKLVSNQVAGGAALKSEVKRVEAVRADVKQRVASARETVRQSSLKLTDVLHIDPLVTLVPQQESDTLVTLIPPARELADLVAEGLDRRPELKESRAFWNALDKERKAAFIAPLIPGIHGEAFNGSFGRTPADSHHSGDYALGVGWKVGAGGIGDVSRIRISEAQLRQEGIHFAQIGDLVAREIVETQTHVNTSKELIDLSK